MPLRWRRWLPVPIVGWCVWQTAQQIPAWRSELTLWSHAARMAPFKPRVALNYAGALLGDGQMRAGMRQLARAQAVADLPHVPAVDRHLTRRTIAVNLRRFREVTR